MQEQLSGALRRALVPAMIAAALPAHALVLGDIEVRSVLGEALDARIAIEQADAQSVDAACFSLMREAAGELPSIREGILTIERGGNALALRVRSLGGIYEPAIALRVRAACPGQAGAVLRQYTLLLDPRPGTQVVPAPPLIERGLPGAATELRVDPGGASGNQAAAPIASLRSRSGDSLRSIAAAVFPRNRGAQAQYLAALREANPALATQPEREALAEGTAIALPDLRTYARAAIDATRAARPQERVRREAPSARAEPAAPAMRPAPVREPARERGSAPVVAATPSAPGPAPRAARSGETFVLKLSSSEVDLSRTRAVDDRVRAQLRERLLVLDADDQVSALLAMRNSLRQLESRVSELQLKLAAVPPSLATARAAEATASPARSPAAPSTAATAPISPPPAAEAPLSTPQISAPATSTSMPAPTPAVPEAPAPSTASSPPLPAASPEPATSSAPPAEPAPRSRPAPRQQSRFDLSPWLWGLVALLTAVALLLAWSLRRRRSHEEETYDYVEDEVPTRAAPRAEPEALGELAHGDLRATIDSDASLPTRLADESTLLRRRYIGERFPEVANRTIVLEHPDSVVKGARLFYEDGAATRAIELLQFAIEENPTEVRLWLALFEVLRLEGQAVAFAELATRFRARHEKSGYWLKVQYIGREIDPGNALYRDENFSKLETIGPSTSRRLAAATYDPIAENWLNAPMDFQNQVLASELRKALMTNAAVAEQDLVPNPMPALRNVEMFTLA